MVFDYGYKVTTFFLIYKFFLTFFMFFFIVCNHTYICGFFRIACDPPFFGGVFRRCAGRMSGGVLTIIRTRIHTRAHVRARGFLDSNF